jgi:hypothetical protein
VFAGTVSYTPAISVAGWSSPVARQAHNLKAAGSNPAPATKKYQYDQRHARRPPGRFLLVRTSCQRLVNVLRGPLKSRRRLLAEDVQRRGSLALRSNPILSWANSTHQLLELMVKVRSLCLPGRIRCVDGLHSRICICYPAHGIRTDLVIPQGPRRGETRRPRLACSFPKKSNRQGCLPRGFR